MTRSSFSPEQVLKIVYGISVSSLPSADFIISAGGETLAANICAAQLLNTPNIFYGSLRQYRASDFTLVLTSYPRQTKRAQNIVQTLKPSVLDPDVLPVSPRSGVLGMLIGGPSGGIAFSRADWSKLAETIENTYASYGISWIVSNSRRTPQFGSELLRSIAVRSNGPITELIDVDGPSASSLSELFANVSGVICTADSSSMISEAIWARKPVIAVEPAKFTLTGNELDYRNWLARNGWMTSLPISSLAAEKLPDLLSTLTPTTRNPLDDLADLLAEKLPHLGN